MGFRVWGQGMDTVFKKFVSDLEDNAGSLWYLTYILNCFDGHVFEPYLYYAVLHGMQTAFLLL